MTKKTLVPDPMLWVQVRSPDGTRWNDSTGFPTSSPAAFVRVAEFVQVERIARGHDNVRVVMKHIEVLSI